nr:hypothetical protein [uncultured Duganella sp.]
MKKTTLALLLGAALCGALPCASAADEAPAPLPPESASIVYKSDGAGMIVQFATSAESESCKGLAPVGKVFAADLLRQKLLGFVYKTVERGNRLINAYPRIDTVVKAGQALQIRGYSSWSDSSPGFRSNGSCGPLTTRFTPQPQHKYEVMFNFANGTCSQDIYDVTEAEQKTPVPSQAIPGCDKP